MDVFGDICQASLLHLTKAAVSRLNSFSGQIIIGPEKARRGAGVHSISLRPFSIERSLFLRGKHANSVIPSITYLLWAVLSSFVSYAQESDWCPAMDYLQVSICIFDSCGFSRMFAFQAGWVEVELCCEVTVSFFYYYR